MALSGLPGLSSLRLAPMLQRRRRQQPQEQHHQHPQQQSLPPAPPPPASPPPPEQQQEGAVPSIDTTNFQRLVSLGQGRHGAVYLCRDAAGTLHAVKSIPRSAIRDAAAAARVLREKELLHVLSGCPAIITLRGTFRDPHCLSFVLEPALAGPLHRHVRAAPGGRLCVATALFYAAELVCAVGAMHRAGIMHRDLKASNVVLDAAGHVKVVDLGCARRFSSAEHAALTYCGTLHCMAPEMVSGAGHSFAVDWWALGVLICEMLSGRPPFPYGTGNDAADNETARAIETSTSDTVRSRVEALGLPETSSSPAAAAARRLAGALLVPAAAERLGSCGGAEEVQAHNVFEGVNWSAAAEHSLPPPEFNRTLGELEAAGVEGGAALSVADQAAFADF